MPEDAALGGSLAEREPGDVVETCTILTTAANEVVAPVHGRMRLGLALTDQHLNLAQLRDDLLGSMTLDAHRWSPTAVAVGDRDGVCLRMLSGFIKHLRQVLVWWG